MTIALILLAILCAALLCALAFVANEHKKKFDFMRAFIEGASDHVKEYYYPGNAQAGIDRGMYNIVLTGLEPFEVLIGFELEYPILGGVGFDYYGHAQSSQPGERHHRLVISTFLGSGPCKFQFLVNRAADDIRVGVHELEDRFTPDVIYPPHWYQKHLGIYG